MNKNNLSRIIHKEGIKHIREIEKKLDQLFEITQCIVCNERKPLSEFSEDKNGYLGYSHICKLCFDKIEQPPIEDFHHTKLKCKQCGEYKDFNFFHKIRRGERYDYCIECTKKMINEKAAQGLVKQCISCGEIKPASTEYYCVAITCKEQLKLRCKICEEARKKELRKQKKYDELK